MTMRLRALLLLPLIAACGDGGSTGPSPDPVTVSTATLPDGTVGVAYSAGLSAAGGTGSFGWSVSSGALPAGLSLTASGAVTGTPTTAGMATFTVRASSGNQSGTRQLTINVLPPDVAIGTTSLPDGAVGTAYNQALAATGGTGTFTWTVVNGALPAGLTLSAGGAISGTPTAGGTSNFTVQASSGGKTATRALTINVAFPAVTVSTATLPDGTVGTAYQQNLAASGGTGTYTWSLASGTLPAGLQLYASGEVSGTPTNAGTSAFTVQVTSGGANATRALSIVIQQPPVSIGTTSLPEGEVGTAYSQALSAAGGVGGYTWSMASGSLPAGLALSGAGVISGTPTTAGSSTFSVRVTSGSQSAVQALTIVVQPRPVTITTTTLKNAVQGVAYADTLRATGGTGSFTWALAAGSSLPAGLSLSAGGVITGIATAQGTTTFTVQATSGTRTATRELGITVQPPNLAITTSTLPAGVVGDPYSATLEASGGTGSYTWTRTAGTLPNGLTLSSAGVISGTPTTQGTSNFTVQVASGAQNVTKALSITIGAALPPVTITTSSLDKGWVGETYNESLEASGGSGSFTWSLASGTLPAGLTLVGSGAITGTPSAAGTSTFTVQASSSGKTATKQLSITIDPALDPVTITTTSPLPGGTVGSAYPNTQFAATGGTGSYTWSVVSGLPAGLTLSSAGVLSGTPTAMVTNGTLTVRATSGPKTTTKQFSITIAAGPVTITTTSLTGVAVVGSSYSRPLQATGGAGPGTYTWSLASGALPGGLTLSSAGVISGTVQAPTGTFNFTVQASSGGNDDTQALSIVVENPVVITTATPLDTATAGTPYSKTLAATGGSGGYTWAVITGSLPGGLTLNANTGVISGTPAAAGTSTFTVRATSGSALTGTKQFSLTVKAGTGTYVIGLNVGNNPTGSVTAGQTIAIPVVVDLSQHGSENIASISVTISWDPNRFEFVSPAAAGNWVDDNSDPASLTPVNTDQVATGKLTFGGTTFGPTTQSFTLRTVTLRAKATGAQVNSVVSGTVNAAGNVDGTAITVTPRSLTVTINP